MKSLKIGKIELETPFVMAPLAGITDAPTRRIYREAGASLVYSEMISAKGIWYRDRNTEALLRWSEEEKPFAYQLFGSEPEIMKSSAREVAEKYPCALIDINMGCPVPKVVRNGEGSALLRNLDLLYEVAYATVQGAGGKPVTAKIRIGWDSTEIVACEAAKALSSAGVAAITVHGRTREQYYSGKANWEAIAAVKAAVSVPVIGNGDVFSAEDALALMDRTDCDGVMIARGALGNPWIFAEANALWRGEEKPAPPTVADRLAMVERHLDDLVAEKGEYAGVREMRKFVGWYMKGVPGAAALRRDVNNIETVAAFKKRLAL